MNWKKGFPTKEGFYWFYGYRWGKISMGENQKPKYYFVDVGKTSNGFMYIADGNFMFESETEEAYFQKIIFPSPPKFFENINRE